MARGVALVALFAASSLLLAGCGKGDPGDSLGGDLPAGGQAGPPSSSSTAPEERPVYGPKLTFPADVKLVFDYTETGDPAKDAVLHDWEAGQRVFAAAEVGPDPAFKLLGQYQTQDAYVTSRRVLINKAKLKQGIIGDRRFYGVKFGQMDSNAADVTWCVDDSKFYARNKATGKAIVVQGPTDYYRVHGYLLNVPSIKRWVLIDYTTQNGVRC